ncbi:glycosyltransferase [Neptuniibacter sp. QD48_11]|uniref:glycosyltransferase n=1 Tax=unclassified Neptuniibacter TaxID=2630693 RepID=UPI0039F502CB
MLREGGIKGTGSQAESAKAALSKEVSSGNVIFLGAISHDVLPKMLSVLDVYISTSFVEGMSVALLEVLKVGIPVVTTRTGEPSRFAQDDFNGRIVDDWNSKNFSS